MIPPTDARRRSYVACATWVVARRRAAPFDILITNARIIDGTGLGCAQDRSAFAADDRGEVGGDRDRDAHHRARGRVAALASSTCTATRT